MAKERQTEILETERRLFKACLVIQGKSLKEWADEEKYRSMYVNQVLANEKANNYLRLRIRTYIAENKELMTGYVGQI